MNCHKSKFTVKVVLKEGSQFKARKPSKAELAVIYQALPLILPNLLAEEFIPQSVNENKEQRK
jgi:hypothetical protein